MPYDLDALKAKHGKKISELTVTTSDDETFVFVLKKPSRHTIEAVSDLESEKKGRVAAVSKIMMANCVIAGNMEALEDGEVYSTVLEEVGKLFTKASATIKKL